MDLIDCLCSITRSRMSSALSFITILPGFIIPLIIGLLGCAASVDLLTPKTIIRLSLMLFFLMQCDLSLLISFCRLVRLNQL